MDLTRFTGGDDRVREKLNKMVDAINALLKSRGDEIFINVERRHDGSGLAFNLNINNILARIPKQVPQQPAIFPVQVTVDGGTAGSMSGTSTCSFTYTLMDESGNITLAKGLTPDTTRYPNCKYNKPTSNSPGVAYFDNNGTIHLYSVAQEQPTGQVVNAIIDLRIDGSNNWQYHEMPILVLDQGYPGTWITWVTGATCPD